jgi:hypothetical protein
VTYCSIPIYLRQFSHMIKIDIVVHKLQLKYNKVTISTVYKAV